MNPECASHLDLHMHGSCVADWNSNHMRDPLINSHFYMQLCSHNFESACLRVLANEDILGLPKEDRGPEQIVRHLIVALPDAVPSVSRLSDCMVDVIDKVLKTTATFNLAQMLQGENIPHSVKSLQTCMQNESEDVLKFYLLALVGMMSGECLFYLKGFALCRGFPYRHR